MNEATATTFIEGVTASVNAAMQSVSATVLAEDGLLLAECEHGIRHPVGTIHEHPIDMTHAKIIARHERHGERFGGPEPCQCCGCCPAGQLPAGAVQPA